MVTGIEAAGLALAIFPLLVGGLNVYIDGCKTIGEWRKYRPILKKLVRELGLEKTKFENTCYVLLEDMVSPEEVTWLMGSPGGENWKSSKFRKLLDNRLRPGTSEAYLEAVGTLRQNLHQLQEIFGLNPKSFELPDDKQIRKRTWKRIKLVLGKEDYKTLQQDIERLNASLATLTGQRRSIEQSTTKVAPAAKYYSQIRTHSVNLYSVFYEKFLGASSCACPAPHNVNLQLEARRIDTNNIKFGAMEVTDLRFKVLFSFDCTPDVSTSIPWKWRAMEIEPVSEEGQVEGLAEGIKRADTACSIATTPKDTGRRSRFLSEVSNQLRKFATSDQKGRVGRVGRALSTVTGRALAPLDVGPGYEKLRKSQSQDITPSKPRLGIRFDLSSEPSTSKKKGTGSLASTTATRIKDLCTTIKPGKAEASCLGVLVHDKYGWHRIWRSAAPSPANSLEAISLESLLNDATSFPRKERLFLGVRLSSAIMQYHDTKWLGEKWSKRDIFFLPAGLKTTQPDFGKPFVRRTFKALATAPGSPGISTSPVFGKPYNSSLFSLGIILVELWEGKCLQEICNPVDLYTMDPNSPDIKLLDKIMYSEEAGAKYGDVVRRCINGLDHRCISLHEDDFKNIVYKDVVSPLEENLKSFCEKPDLPLIF